METNNEDREQRVDASDAGKVVDIAFHQSSGGNASEENQSSSQKEGSNEQEKADHSIVLSPNMSTVCWILENGKVPIQYDEFSGQILVSIQGNPKPEAWSDHRSLEITESLQRKYPELRSLSKHTVDQAILLYAKKHPCNQLIEKLDSLTWDGKPRLDTWLINYCGVAQDNPYTREVGKCWLLGAVKRAYEPGSKFDYCLILEGKQGIGKSTLLSILSCGYFQKINDFTGKDALMLLGGTWIAELEELNALKKSDMEVVKGFLTKECDRFRPPYGKLVESKPRTVVFAGTTNKDDYLRDETGNRRFLPVSCTELRIEEFQQDRDQLLAEAVHRYRQGESLLLSKEAQQIAIYEQQARLPEDPWKGYIAKYLANKESVVMDEIFIHVLGMTDPRTWNRSHETRVGTTLCQLGWQKRRRRGPGQKNVYYPPVNH